MKLPILLITVTVLLTTACKKQTKDITAGQPSISVDAPVPCTGDTWDPALAYSGLNEVPYFVYKNKAYFVNSGWPGSPFQNTMRIYDGVTWQSYGMQSPPFSWSVTELERVVTFVIGDKGYLCYTGGSPTYEYDFATHTWESVEIFPGIPRKWASSFVIGNKAYVVAGRDMSLYDNDNLNDCWGYDPAEDKWTQKASFENIGRSGATGFSVGNKGYIANGNVLFPNNFTLYLRELLEYNPGTDSWSTKAQFPGAERNFSMGFVINGKSYVGGGGGGGNLYEDFYRYTQSSNTWTRIQDIPVLYPLSSGFCLGNNGYVLWRYPANNSYRFDKYTPKTCTPVSSGSISTALSN